MAKPPNSETLPRGIPPYGIRILHEMASLRDRQRSFVVMIYIVMNPGAVFSMSFPMNYRFLSPALAEIRESAKYYDERVSGLGADFLDELDAALHRILPFSEAWARPGANRKTVAGCAWTDSMPTT